MACDQCQQFCQVKRVRTGDEYRELLRKVLACINSGILLLLDGIELERILGSAIWPDDDLTHRFECTKCHQQFTLSVNTYHGRGGYWKPAEPPDERYKGLRWPRN